MINTSRLREYFLAIVQIDSPSREEAALAERLTADLAALGIAAEMDDAGAATGGASGNLIARVPGTVPGALPLFLSAHMDTVSPGKGVKPQVNGDIVSTDGTTV
ncbi:MAG: hypothetical protein NTZ05_00905, partial [Chloroflexi bacterium]|nr:hypothetical protein [Chloroflexota bacterium]